MELRLVLNMCQLYVWGSRMLHKGHYVVFLPTKTGEAGTPGAVIYIRTKWPVKSCCSQGGVKPLDTGY